MKRLILYIIVSFLLVNCKAPSYLPKEHKIGEQEKHNTFKWQWILMRTSKKIEDLLPFLSILVMLF